MPILSYSSLPFWPNPSGYSNIDLSLDRVYGLLERLGNPQLKAPPTIHIAGTNGKGSTLSYLKAIFSEAGLKAHCYTSPHLVNFNERIVLANKEIDNDFLNETLKQCKQAAELEPEIKVTFFEGITVAAFVAFSKIKADILLLETGMGGRLDATNVIKKPIATIITPISFDHTEFLGKTLAKIAFEKAGIIKEKSPVILGKQKASALRIIKKIAQKNDSKILALGENWHTENINQQNWQMTWEDKKQKLILPMPALIGEHQIQNAGMAIATIMAQKHFKINKKNIVNGLKKAIWPARLQKINYGNFYQILPKNFELILDGGHNEAGAKTIASWLKSQEKKSTISQVKYKNYLICAMLQDKDSSAFLKHLSKLTEMLLALKINNESKSKNAEEIADIAENLNIKSQTAKSFREAIEIIKKYHLKNIDNKTNGRILICGSLYLAGQFLKENEGYNN